MPRATKNLLGQRFGKLEVIEFDGYKKGKYHRNAYWKCKCDCGNTKSIQASQLLSGNSSTCGCSKMGYKEKDDIVGMKFNRLTAIKRVDDERKGVRYLFLCDCGKKKVILKNAVVSGRTKSCGCISNEKVRERCFKDLTNKKFGRLTAISIDSCDNGKTYWRCKCDCGNEHVVLTNRLISGHTTSCGCRKEEINKAISDINKTHELSNSRIYGIYRGMISRCYKKYSNNYNRYGGRGITICKEWLDDFMNFYKWAMENGYYDDLSIDRIDVNGNYCPENCRWATAKEQANNTRSTVFLTYNGQTKSASEWSRITGISRNTITRRKRSGWTDEECLTIKAGEKRV